MNIANPAWLNIYTYDSGLGLSKQKLRKKEAGHKASAGMLKKWLVRSNEFKRFRNCSK